MHLLHLIQLTQFDDQGQVNRIFLMTPNQLQVLFELRSGVKQLALADQEYLGIFGATGKPKESGQDIQGTHLE